MWPFSGSRCQQMIACALKIRSTTGRRQPRLSLCQSIPRSAHCTRKHADVDVVFRTNVDLFKASPMLHFSLVV
jgi:hypothetical protein